MLPEAFVNRMKTLLGDEYNDFEACFREDCLNYQSLRVNTLKAAISENGEPLFNDKSRFHLTAVPWCERGFYYEQEDIPGKHPYHEAGLYYIQEASAMAPVTYLDIQKGDRVLDLCASPGGKSTQIAALLNNEGLLVSNEINPQRAKILSLNIERLGIKKAMVTNEDSFKLAGVFDGFFNKILVDAPCSGEGMFRKNEVAIKEWSMENTQACADRQAEILDNAADMLSPGGRLVYSTCTFAPIENEGTVSAFLHRHPEFELVKALKKDNMSGGNPAYISGDNKVFIKGSEVIPADNLDFCIRLWPHKLRGEGHFLAVLKKKGDENLNSFSFVPGGGVKALKGKALLPWEEFAKDSLKEETIKSLKENGTIFAFGDQLYLAPKDMPSTDGLKVLRPGLHLGTVKKDRFEPSHALALYLNCDMVKRSYEFSSESLDIKSYLNGQTFRCECEKGWNLITCDGYSIGWAKYAGGSLKNHYPKGLRINY
ncbi:MAG: RsmB/NOP family class I SAM-dependent RNA methyltransferase [Butyrivibrio sp.]|nr:RsmB/NOP family class I SAM-dependent RNA methyltransferase [Butyrivibrio sp.]